MNHWQRLYKQDLKAKGVVVNDIDEEEAPVVYTLPTEVDPPLERNCQIKIKLRGPFSPLETTVRSVTSSGGFKSITIDHTSVNSILLDNKQVWHAPILSFPILLQWLKPIPNTIGFHSKICSGSFDKTKWR